MTNKVQSVAWVFLEEAHKGVCFVMQQPLWWMEHAGMSVAISKICSWAYTNAMLQCLDQVIGHALSEFEGVLHKEFEGMLYKE